MVARSKSVHWTMLLAVEVSFAEANESFTLCLRLSSVFKRIGTLLPKDSDGWGHGKGLYKPKVTDFTEIINVKFYCLPYMFKSNLTIIHCPKIHDEIIHLSIRLHTNYYIIRNINKNKPQIVGKYTILNTHLYLKIYTYCTLITLVGDSSTLRNIFPLSLCMPIVRY